MPNKVHYSKFSNETYVYDENDKQIAVLPGDVTKDPTALMMGTEKPMPGLTATGGGAPETYNPIAKDTVANVASGGGTALGAMAGTALLPGPGTLLGGLLGGAATSYGVDSLLQPEKDRGAKIEDAIINAGLNELIPRGVGAISQGVRSRARGVTPYIKQVAEQLDPRIVNILEKFGIRGSGGQLTGNPQYKSLESNLMPEQVERELVNQNITLGQSGNKMAAKMGSTGGSSSTPRNTSYRIEGDMDAFIQKVPGLKANMQRNYPQYFQNGTFKFPEAELEAITSDPFQFNDLISNFKHVAHRPEFKGMVADMASYRFAKTLQQSTDASSGMISFEEFTKRWNDPTFRPIRNRLYTKEMQEKLGEFTEAISAVNRNMGQAAKPMALSIDPHSSTVHINSNANTNLGTGLASGSKVTMFRGIIQKLGLMFGKKGMPIETFTRSVLRNPEAMDIAISLMKTPITSKATLPLYKALIGAMGNTVNDLTFNSPVKVDTSAVGR
jgi:hypothetical protein